MIAIVTLCFERIAIVTLCFERIVLVTLCFKRDCNSYPFFQKGFQQISFVSRDIRIVAVCFNVVLETFLMRRMCLNRCMILLKRKFGTLELDSYLK